MTLQSSGASGELTARVVAMCNQKGGVGKTTATFHLAAAAAKSGLRCLLVDHDPQGNLTAIASAEEVPADQAGLADVLSTQASETLADVIVPAVWDGVDLVPTVGETLGVVRNELVVAMGGREKRTREALALILGDYDLVLIDCPPALDLLLMNALVAADSAAIVAEATLFGADGIHKLLGTINDVRAHYNPTLAIAGVMLNKVDPQTISAGTWSRSIRQDLAALGIDVLDPPIPNRVAIKDSSEAAVSLDQWSRDARAIAHLFDRHLEHLMEKRTL